jgi:hypothetical protein
MSNWNPAPQGSGDRPGDPGQVPSDPQPPGPGYVSPPGQGYGPGLGQGYGPGPGQGYGPAGQPGQGYGPPQGPGGPAPQWYGPPGMGGYQPSRRRGFLRRGGISVGVLVVVIIVVSVVTYVRGSHTWKLTAPSTAAGLPRDTDSLDTLELSTAVSGARSAVSKVPGYGTIKSSVSAAYKGGSGPLVWFIGFNGTFKQQIVLKGYQGARVLNVSAGSHGGVAECARGTSATLCQWSTTSTVGDVIIRTSILGGPVPIATAESLMIKMRNSVEHPG